jgi:hypothetical protein
MDDAPRPAEQAERTRLVRFLRTRADEVGGVDTAASRGVGGRANSIRDYFHELVDLSAEMASVLAAITRTAKQRLPTPPREMMPGLRPRQPAAGGVGDGVAFDPVVAGEVRSTRISVVNDGATAVTMRLSCSDLSAGALGRIPAGSVTIEPRTIDVPSVGAAEFILTINVPRAARPGVYVGVLQDADNPRIRTAVRLEVR